MTKPEVDWLEWAELKDTKWTFKNGHRRTCDVEIIAWKHVYETRLHCRRTRSPSLLICLILIDLQDLNIDKLISPKFVDDVLVILIIIKINHNVNYKRTSIKLVLLRPSDIMSILAKHFYVCFISGFFFVDCSKYVWINFTRCVIVVPFSRVVSFIWTRR